MCMYIFWILKSCFAYAGIGILDMAFIRKLVNSVGIVTEMIFRQNLKEEVAAALRINPG